MSEESQESESSDRRWHRLYGSVVIYTIIVIALLVWFSDRYTG